MKYEKIQMFCGEPDGRLNIRSKFGLLLQIHPDFIETFAKAILNNFSTEHFDHAMIEFNNSTGEVKKM